MWEQCLAEVQKIAGSSVKVQEITNVDWSKISQADLDNQFQGDKPFPLICPDRHCTDNVDISPASHHFCNCQDINGHTIPDCTPKSGLTPMGATVCLDVKHPTNSQFYGKAGRNCTNLGESFYVLNCYCCCSCYANGTLIAVPMGVKKIEDFQVGDNVMTASLGGEVGSPGLAWAPRRVSFSFGTGEGLQQHMVYIHFGDSGSMICTPDQLFLLTTGKIKRGDRLVPGSDQLVSAQGLPVELHEISLGVYHGGVHHIATTPSFNGDLQGHLLDSAGIVTGDFDLQIHAPELKDKFFVENHDQLPVVGSEAYAAAYSQLSKTDVATYSTSQRPSPIKLLQFFAHKDKRYDIPADAASYLSAAQAADIADAKLGITFEQISQSNVKVNNLLATFSGHYKDIDFVLLMGHMEVNAFAYQQYGQKFVALTDGLTRLEGMDIEGLALILAHLINRLSKSPPNGANGWMSVAFADYLIGGVMQNVYLSQAAVLYSRGAKQLDDVLFKHISTANNSYVDDPYKPTTATRDDAMDAGFEFGFPPAGIGGPELGGLHVVGATVSAPQFGAASFVTRDISEADSQAVFAVLTNNGILDANGMLKGPVTPKTNLSFLFSDVSDPDKRTYLIATVRYTLIDADHEVAVSFNLGTGNRPIHPDDFEFTPPAQVDGVTKGPGDGGDVALVSARLETGGYTVTVRDVLSANGSTISPDHNSANITVN